MKYIVYKTTNMVNQKIYIGVHITEDPEVFDGYIGCGISYPPKVKIKGDTILRKAVRKYGYKNFKRETLFVFEGDEEGMKQAYAKEAELVTEDFVKRPDTYNMMTGGHFAGWEVLKKRINQYTLEGKFIKTWDSISDAGRAIGAKFISSALTRGKSHQSYGFQWRYYDGNTDDIEPTSYIIRNVYQFTLTGEFIKMWNTANEAALEYSVKSTSIRACCRGKLQQSGGYRWSYNSVLTPIKYKRAKPLATYDDNGKFVKYYNSIRDALKKVHANFVSVTNALNNPEKRCKGYRWRYFNGDTSDIEPIR